MHHRQNRLESTVKLYSSVHVMTTEEPGSDPQEKKECFQQLFSSLL
jgi:hypothetical protein